MVRHAFLFFALTVAVVFTLSARTALAADTALTISCPNSALNLNLYGKMLTDEVRATVDPTLFRQVRVRIRWRLMGSDTTSIGTSSGQVLSGLSLSQTGLISSVSGALSFQPSCQFRYVVRVTVSGTEISSGARLSASNEGVVTVSSGGEVQIRKRGSAS